MLLNDELTTHLESDPPHLESDPDVTGGSETSPSRSVMVKEPHRKK